MGIQELKYRAPEGSVLVAVSPPKTPIGGILEDPFTEKRPDRGRIVDASDSGEVSIGDNIIFNHRGATQVEGDIWSVELDSLLGILEPEGEMPA